ncbi:MAG: thiamine pyrophosphate-dependent enzyme [Syntrophobacteria bacterium]
MTATVTRARESSGDEITYMRPVSNCAGCGDTKVSWSVSEGMKRFNRSLGLKGRDRYRVIYAADRGCGNLQGYHAYRIVDTIFCMGSGVILGEGIKESCSERQVVVTASGDGGYNFNMSGFKFAAKNKQWGAIAIVYNNYNIRMTGGQMPLEVDFDREGSAMGFEVIHINPYRVDENAELFKELMGRYFNKDKVMVVADGVCVVDMIRETRGVGLTLGHFVKSNECLDLKFEQEKERIAREEPEKLKDLPRFKCRLCGIGLRCHALLNNDPTLCLGCGACKQFPCPVGALSFQGPSFADSTSITELVRIHKQ